MSHSALHNPYPENPKWFRGNLHTHTTASDGRDTPQAVVNHYARLGYDFLVITDHNLVLSLKELDAHGMLLVPGEELTHPRTHVVGIDLKETLPRGESTQEQIDLITGAGGLAVVAHPNWMGLTVEEIAPLRGHLAIELTNQICFRDNGRGDSVAWWDALLTQGHRCWGVSVDDCHILALDAGRGWVTVAAEERSWPAIRAALTRGAFIASTGPRIEEVQVQDRSVWVKASTCVEIRFIGSGGRELFCSGFLSINGTCEARYEVPEPEPFVRVEVADTEGGRAWTQPFWTITR